MMEHKIKAHKGFTEQYGVDRLVWYTTGSSIRAAIELEKKIKNRGRQWKIDLIEKTNPNWHDLCSDLLDSATSRRMTGELDSATSRRMTGELDSTTSRRMTGEARHR